ncbi:hypothetical protein SETIT_2G201700v2 [Setaria italica]|uniref:C2H2-type domain-containing protein n=3 Tax=Setaria TaxID=4554 RepID=A0A368Q1F4_SETIT|nr:transcriptional regulator SUPERMAN [Setaria italica]XP_034583085.1 transcriptional regulator SUPERMAN-like [Setaria viridis]RCV11624.1 hypothetical protein SETIT_2G201700v2 [Setaria italica]TKW33077.1 hypothetical protein SEVIR_2G209800v2 [Setaria viridis]
MERDDGYTKLQQLPCSDNFSLAASSSWPSPQIRSSSSATSHICGYCKREFRSAQGLGGHMNVHRLDRARLIHHQCSSHHHLALAAPPPNPNPSRAVVELMSSGCRAHGAASDGGSAVPPAAKPGVCRFSLASSSSALTKDIEAIKNLELRMGACSHGDDAEERLDLELRLGHS